MLSPNEESRGPNALVFGLSGALVGAVAGFLAAPSEPTPSEAEIIETREKQKAIKFWNEFLLAPETNGKALPDFLKNRIAPAIVEEYVEQDLVGEDGALHTPHKVYRIKRQAELIARPKPQSEGDS